MGGAWGGDRGGALPGGAAQEGFEADKKDVQVEWFGEVVVSTGFDAFKDIFRAGTGGEHKNRGVMLFIAEGADYCKAVGTGQHAVEKDSRDWFSGREEVSECGIAVGFVMSAITFGLKVEEDALREMLLVFDEDNERGFGFSHEGLIGRLSAA